MKDFWMAVELYNICAVLMLILCAHAWAFLFWRGKDIPPSFPLATPLIICYCLLISPSCACTIASLSLLFISAGSGTLRWYSIFNGLFLFLLFLLFFFKPILDKKCLMRKLGYVMGITDLGSAFRNFKNWGGESPPNKNLKKFYFDPCRVRKGQGQRYYGFWSLGTWPKYLEKNFAHSYSSSPFMGVCQEMGQSYLLIGERCYWKSKHAIRYLIDIAWA